MEPRRTRKWPCAGKWHAGMISRERPECAIHPFERETRRGVMWRILHVDSLVQCSYMQRGPNNRVEVAVVLDFQHLQNSFLAARLDDCPGTHVSPENFALLSERSNHFPGGLAPDRGTISALKISEKVWRLLSISITR